MKKKATIREISEMLDKNVDDCRKVDIDFIIKKIKENLPRSGISLLLCVLIAI